MKKRLSGNERTSRAKTAITGVRIDPAMRKRLEAERERTGAPFKFIIQRALDEYLTKREAAAND